MPATYPENPVTVGDHIRKKRMELKLLQCDVAKLLKAHEASISNWEINKSQPHVNYFPRIIKFLGYLPIEVDTSTLAGKLKDYRYRNGLSQKRLGRVLEIDGSTLGDLENGVGTPQDRILKKLEVLLNTTLPYTKQRKTLYALSYIENPVTLGDHIRKKRINLKLFQCDVATILKVSSDILCNWETNLHTPQVSYYPRIFAFLGYMPFEFDTTTLPGRLKAYRYRNGLSQSQLAKIFNVGRSAVDRWEKEENVPKANVLKKLNQLLAAEARKGTK